jgi:hypothetical protein
VRGICEFRVRSFYCRICIRHMGFGLFDSGGRQVQPCFRTQIHRPGDIDSISQRCDCPPLILDLPMQRIKVGLSLCQSIRVGPVIDLQKWQALANKLIVCYAQVSNRATNDWCDPNEFAKISASSVLGSTAVLCKTKPPEMSAYKTMHALHRMLASRLRSLHPSVSGAASCGTHQAQPLSARHDSEPTELAVRKARELPRGQREAVRIL